MARGVEKLLYSRQDAARALSLSLRSIDYLIYTGRIPTRRVGGKILIHVTDVRQFAKRDHPAFLRVPPRSEQVPDHRKTA
jgi:excisionase family DNA binding protein